MIKYSAFYPPEDIIGVKGTALPATRNVNQGEWDSLPIGTTLNRGDTVQYYGSTFVVNTTHIKGNATAGPDQNPNYDAYAVGSSGEPLYMWIAYADSADGTTNFTLGAPGERTYIGVAANKQSATESTNAADYTWSKFQGPKGPTITVVASRAGFTHINGALNPNPQTINFAASVSAGLNANDLVWFTSPAIKPTGYGSTFSITSAEMGANSQVVVRASLGDLNQVLLISKIADPAADPTGQNTAFGFIGQKDLATTARAQLPFGANGLVNTDFTRGLAFWRWPFATTSGITTVARGVNLSSDWSGVRNVYYGQVMVPNWNQNQTNTEWFDFMSSAGTWNGGTLEELQKYAIPVKDGDRIFFRALVARHRCNVIVYALIQNKYGNLVIDYNAAGGRVNGGAFGNPVNFDEVGGVATVAHPDAAYLTLMVRMLPTGEGDPYAFVTEPALGIIPNNQTTIPPYQPGRNDPQADITKDNAALGILNQAATATNSDFSAVTGSTKPEPNADVTSLIVPTIEGNIQIQADSTGTIKAGQLPKPIDLRLVRNGATVYTGISWSYLVMSGILNGLNFDSGPQALAGDGPQSFMINSLTGSSARIRFVSSYNGTTRQLDKVVEKVSDTAPVGGGGGGGTGGSTSQTNAIANTLDDTNWAETPVPSMSTGSGGNITFTAPLNFQISGVLSGTVAAYGMWQYKLPASNDWISAGAEVPSEYSSTRYNSSTPRTPHEETFPENGTSYTEDGYIAVNQYVSGLSPNTTYDVRLLLRDSHSTRYVFFTGTATAQGS